MQLTKLYQDLLLPDGVINRSHRNYNTVINAITHKYPFTGEEMVALRQILNSMSPKLVDFPLKYESVFGAELLRVFRVDCGFTDDQIGKEHDVRRILQKVGQTYKICSFQLLEAFQFCLENNPALLTPYRAVSTRFVAEVVKYWQDNRVYHGMKLLAAMEGHIVVETVFSRNKKILLQFASERSIVVSNVLSILNGYGIVVNGEFYVAHLYNLLVDIGVIRNREQGQPHPYRDVWDKYKDLKKTQEAKIYLSRIEIITKEVKAFYSQYTEYELLEGHGYMTDVNLDEHFENVPMTLQEMVQRYGKGIVRYEMSGVFSILKRIAENKKDDEESFMGSGTLLKQKLFK